MTLDPRWKFPQGKSPEHLYDALYQLIRELRKGDYLQQAGLQRLAFGTVTDVASLDIGISTYTGYRALVIRLDGYVPQTGGSNLLFRTSSDGSTFDDGASDYAWGAVEWGAEDTPGFAEAGDASASSVVLGDFSNAAGEHASIEVEISLPFSASLYKRITA
jgi:hypothetical protein